MQTAVIEAIQQTEKGTSYGIPCLRAEIAELVVQAVPNIDKVRFINSGTEACMSAVAIPSYTGKEKIIKFAGYSSHSDANQAGSGAVTFDALTVRG